MKKSCECLGTLAPNFYKARITLLTEIYRAGVGKEGKEK